MYFLAVYCETDVILYRDKNLFSELGQAHYKLFFTGDFLERLFLESTKLFTMNNLHKTTTKNR